MSCELCMLTERRMERIFPRFPKSRGWPRGDDRLIPGGTIHVRKRGILWDQTPRENGN